MESMINYYEIMKEKVKMEYFSRMKKILIVDVAVPDDVNVLIKETEKRLKYKDLQIEISRMWNVQAKVVAVVVGALGTMSDNFNKEIELIHRKIVEDIQNIALNGTAHILRKVLGWLIEELTSKGQTFLFVYIRFKFLLVL